MASRRDFLKGASVLTLGGVLAPELAFSAPAVKKNKAAKGKTLGLQTYSLGPELNKDGKMAEVLVKLHDAGYTELELAGYDGNGKVSGVPMAEYKKMVDDAGLRVMSSHMNPRLDRGEKYGKATKAVPDYRLCGLLIVLALLNTRPSEQPVKAVLQEGEALTLTDQAIENYLYSAGFTLAGETILDGSGQEIAALSLSRDEHDVIKAMTLSFPLTTYIPTEDDEGLVSLKKDRDAESQRDEELFLSLFDAVAATDGRIAARRDNSLEKLRKTMDTGKAFVQNANSWRFSFSLAPDLLEGTVTVLFTLVK